MESNSTKKYCVECGREKNASVCDFCKKETNNRYSLVLTERIKNFNFLIGKQKQLGVGGWLRECLHGFRSSGNKAKHPEGVEIHRDFYHKKDDWCNEIVRDNKTGDIVRECHEKLSEHVGRGSAKKPNNL